MGVEPDHPWMLDGQFLEAHGRPLALAPAVPRFLPHPWPSLRAEDSGGTASLLTNCKLRGPEIDGLAHFWRQGVKNILGTIRRGSLRRRRAAFAAQAMLLARSVCSLMLEHVYESTVPYRFLQIEQCRVRCG